MFGSLQTVVFNLYGGPGRSGAYDIPPIRARMKVLDRSGVLQFIVGNWSVIDANCFYPLPRTVANVGTFVFRKLKPSEALLA